MECLNIDFIVQNKLRKHYLQVIIQLIVKIKVKKLLFFQNKIKRENDNLIDEHTLMFELSYL